MESSKERLLNSFTLSIRECGPMTILCLFLLAISLLVGGLLCMAYRETEQDYPPRHRCHRR
jgi:hypothetical protein